MDVGTRLGHYEITGRLGAGGMGEVYRAHDSKLDRAVAIKMLPEAVATEPTLLARFEREAKLLAAVVHPNIATVHSVEVAGARPYLVMELVRGTTLADRLRDGALPLAEALEINGQIARGLEAAHKQAIVHRDLKPANIVITPGGLVKIIDFGIAKALVPGTCSSSLETPPDGPTAALELTATGTQIGTAPYMSPEQVRGQPVDARSDIWAFGCVAYETLTGRRAFGRETAADTLSAILSEEPDWQALPPATPANVRSVLARCLEKDTRRRLHSIADARIEIEDSITGSGVTASQAPGLASAPSGHRPAWIAAGLAALAVVVLAADVGGLRDTLVGGWVDARGERAGDATTTTLASVISLVALPSSVIGDQAQQYLTDAIPTRLTAELSRSGAVTTRLPPSQLRFDALDGDLEVLAGAYLVDAFLMSSVVAGADALTLQLQLIASDSHEVLWASGDYAGSSTQFFTPVRSAANELAAALGGGSADLDTPLPTSEDTAAQQAFERGKYFAGRYNNLRLLEDYALGYSAFEEALELDPTLADAAAELAFLSYLQIEGDGPPEGVAEQVAGWIGRALEIDSTNGLAWTIRSMAMAELSTTPDLATELEYARRGVVFAPHLAIAHSTLGGVLNTASSRLAQPAYERSVRLDALHVYSRLNLAIIFLLRGEYDDAMLLTRGALAFEAGFTYGLLALASALVATGQHDEAATTMDRVAQAVADGRFAGRWTLPTLADLAAARSNADLVEDLSDRMLSALDATDARYFDAFFVGLFTGPHFIRSRPEVALHLLVRADELGYLAAFDALRDSPRFEPLRDEPAFQNLLDAARRRHEQMIASLQAAQLRGELPGYLEEPLAREAQRARDGA